MTAKEELERIKKEQEEIVAQIELAKEKKKLWESKEKLKSLQPKTKMQKMFEGLTK